MKTTCTFSVFHFHVVLVTTSFGARAAFFFFMYRDDQCLVAVLSVTNSECQEMKIKCLSFFKTAHPLNYYDYFFKKSFEMMLIIEYCVTKTTVYVVLPSTFTISSRYEEQSL